MSARLIPNEIVRATNGRLAAGSAMTMLNGVSVSARTVSPGCLFVPLSANGADGHRDIDTALHSGAGGALCARSSGKLAGLVKKWPAKILIEVEDTLEALLNLACFWRRKIQATAVIGAPGSEAVLRLAADMLKTKRSPLYIRSESGALHETALRLLELNANHGWVMIELAHDCALTAARLCAMSMPAAAVIVDDAPCARALLNALEAPAVVFVPAGSTDLSGCGLQNGVVIIDCGAGKRTITLLSGDAPERSELCMALALTRHLGLEPQDMQAGLDVR